MKNEKLIVYPSAVIPAKAGIQTLLRVWEKRTWIPAFAGMTTGRENDKKTL